uniref:BED-type domain-containing protein n=1 Tax=Lactuca sativa TaxID=4236 RepID=A0A9R1UVZ1_LACSA|nr:hypothetical protein LSAT_V11C800400750 [Lactuca sativa]
MDDGGSTTNLLSPNKGMGVVTGVGIDNPSSQSVHGMDHTTTPNEETTSQIPNENESVREKNNETDEDEVQLTRKRKKTSKVWDDFVVVTLRDGKKKAECKHCESRLAITGSGPTSSYKRHLNSCTPHKQSLKNQQILNFQPSGCDVDFVPPLIGPDTKYDENKMREAIANWILSTEQPFATVEDVMFVKMMKTATPLFEKLSRVTITLKALTKAASKISLTTDCWKSSHQKIEYMVITAHFVDHNWRLQKRVLSFVHVPPPRTAVDIADGIYKCLQEWEIKDKIFTISVDNAAYNDKALRRLKETFSRVRKLSCGGRLFHIRCCAHILNLLVKDGLAIIDHIIGDVREGIKYINNSEGRRLNFSKAAHQMQIRDRKLMLDVPTRWNSTYDMLCMALKFKDAFPRYTQIYLKYAEYEPHFHHLPTDEDWENVQSVCLILKVFKVCTNIISGSDYPTANLYLIEVFRVKQTLDKGSLSTNDFIRDMVKKMKEKFDKYWGECHLVMAIASVLDPRFKMKLVEFCFPTLYQNSDENIKEVKNALYEMYSEYLEMHDTLVRESATHGSEHERNVLGLNEGTSLGSGWEAFGEFIKTADLERPEKSELDMYLEEGVYREKGQTGMESFNALEWWNVHKLKYRVLSLMARDVLAIPISTVASEATFSAGGRVIDPYRASLGSDTVQMLICGGDWIRQVHGVKKKLKEEFPIEVLLPEVNTKFCVSEE